MRFETINASYYLVSRLQYAQNVKYIRDEGDIILLDLKNDEQVMILIVERGINLGEVQYYFKTNTKQGIHTLMILWVDMFIARDGTHITMPDWMAALDSVHRGKIYGYEVAARTAWFFPIYLEGKGMKRTVRYGNVVNYANIGGHMQKSQSPFLGGTWRVGGFDAVGEGYSDEPYNERYRHGSPLAVYYEALGLQDGAALDIVKTYYRNLARQYHPDLNPDSDAVNRMAQINDAYQRILQHLAD